MSGPGALGGLTLATVVGTLAVLTFNAVTTPPDTSIVGTVTGPCGTPPSPTVRVYNDDGELAGQGWIAVSDWADACQGEISVNSVAASDGYTVDAGPLSAWLSADRVYETMTIKLRRAG